MLAKHQPPLRIQSQPIRTHFSTSGHRARVPARLQVLLGAFALAPPENHIVRNIREEKIASVPHPDWPFCPGKAAGQFLNHRVLWDYPIERRIEPFNFTKGRIDFRRCPLGSARRGWAGAGTAWTIG